MSKCGDVRWRVEVTIATYNWIDGVYSDRDVIDINDHVDNAYDWIHPQDLEGGTVEVIRQVCIDDDTETWLTQETETVIDLFSDRYMVVYKPTMLAYGKVGNFHDALGMVDDAQRNGDPDRSHWGILDRSTDYMWNA